jgi:hypothetical protein
LPIELLEIAREEQGESNRAVFIGGTSKRIREFVEGIGK